MSTKERFEAKFLPEPNSGCWLWTAGVWGKGYGCFWLNGHHAQAHRAAYEMFVGPIPGGLSVLHGCDTPCCVNPRHLYVGTHTDNMRDRRRRGRIAWGERHPRAKLSERDVLSIRSDPRPVKEIAAQYGMSGATIYAIKTGARWRHVLPVPVARAALSDSQGDSDG